MNRSVTPIRRDSLPILSRRTAVKGACATLGAVAFVGAVSPLRKVAEDITPAEFFQQHYQELSDEDKRQVFARLEAESEGGIWCRSYHCR